MYIPTNVNVATNQREKFKKALEEKGPISIKLNAIDQHNNGNPPCLLLLTTSQKSKLERAKIVGKPYVTIRLSKRQVHANVSHKGGFLGLLAGLAAKALPVLAKGVATGLVSGAVRRVVSSKKKNSDGDGLYLHKSGHCVKIDPVKGNGLYLTPHHRLSTPHGDGDGLYLKRGSTIQDGSGLIFGANSPFKNIPILNLLL